jgi:methyl-accepting chemotaxis protein
VPETVARRKILVDRKFQLQYLYIWLWVGVGMVCIALLFYVFRARVLGSRALDPAVVRLMTGMSGFLVLFCVLMGVIAVFLTHRVAGAAYRLERCIRDLAAGKLRERIALRSGDYLQTLAEALVDLQSSLRAGEEKRQRLAQDLEALRDALDRAGAIDGTARAMLTDTATTLRAEPEPLRVLTPRPGTEGQVTSGTSPR